MLENEENILPRMMSTSALLSLTLRPPPINTLSPACSSTLCPPHIHMYLLLTRMKSIRELLSRSGGVELAKLPIGRTRLCLA